MEEHRLSAIMFTDIVDFTTKMEDDEVKMLRLLQEHDRLIKATVEEQQGEVIKGTGDGFLVRFDSAINSVLCAITVQQALVEFNRDKPKSDQIQIRIGIHLGDIVLREGDVFGDGVNVASRVQPLAEPGGICVTRVVYDMVKRKIDIKAVELGPQQLKNVEEAVDVFQLLVGTVGKPIIRRKKNLKKIIVATAASGVLAMVIIAVLSRFGLFGRTIYYSNYEYLNDGRSIALNNEQGRRFKLMSPPPNDLFTSVTIVEPKDGESVKCLLTTQDLKSGYGQLICLDAEANEVFRDSILESDVPSTPESWKKEPGYECDGAWVEDLDGDNREIIALFHNSGYFARCIRVYGNQVNRKLLMSVWHRGLISIRGYWDVLGDSNKEILCTGVLNISDQPRPMVVFCLKFMEGGVRIPTSVFNRISDEQDTITTGWDCLQWYVIIPLPAQSDSDAIANFSIATFTCSDKGDGKDAEIVIATSDGRIYWISGDGEQLSVGLGDFGRTKYGNRKIRADIIRITPQNLDSLETWWSNKRLYLRFAD